MQPIYAVKRSKLIAGAQNLFCATLIINFRYEIDCVVGLSGLEPPTSRLSGVRSNRLSYKPILPFGSDQTHIYQA